MGRIKVLNRGERGARTEQVARKTSWRGPQSHAVKPVSTIFWLEEFSPAAMSQAVQPPPATGWRSRFLRSVADLRQREGQIFLILALVIGALTGLAVVAFILLTERMGIDGKSTRLNSSHLG